MNAEEPSSDDEGSFHYQDSQEQQQHSDEEQELYGASYKGQSSSASLSHQTRHPMSHSSHRTQDHDDYLERVDPYGTTANYHLRSNDPQFHYRTSPYTPERTPYSTGATPRPFEGMFRPRRSGGGGGDSSNGSSHRGDPYRPHEGRSRPPGFPGTPRGRGGFGGRGGPPMGHLRLVLLVLLEILTRISTSIPWASQSSSAVSWTVDVLQTSMDANGTIHWLMTGSTSTPQPLFSTPTLSIPRTESCGMVNTWLMLPPTGSMRCWTMSSEPMPHGESSSEGSWWGSMSLNGAKGPWKSSMPSSGLVNTRTSPPNVIGSWSCTKTSSTMSPSSMLTILCRWLVEDNPHVLHYAAGPNGCVWLWDGPWRIASLCLAVRRDHRGCLTSEQQGWCFGRHCPGY